MSPMTTPESLLGTPLEEQWSSLDQTEKVIIREAVAEGLLTAQRIGVIDDETGRITAAVLAASEAPVTSWSVSRDLVTYLRCTFADAISAGRLAVPDAPVIAPFAAAAGGPEGLTAVLARLPKALKGLAARTGEARAFAGAGEMVFVGGARTKHMTTKQTDLLERLFTSAHASRGLGKSRALIARDAAGAGAAPAPEVSARTVSLAVQGQRTELALRAVGGVFGAAQPDPGSLLLWSTFDETFVADTESVSAARRLVDLGSGNGMLAACAALAIPHVQVIGTDDDADAVVSTRATLAANGLLDAADAPPLTAGVSTAPAAEAGPAGDGAAGPRMQVHWDTSASLIEDGSVDVVLLNPPFHDGAAVDATLVKGLLDAAARILRPDGALWFVHNSHLRYRHEVEMRIGPSQEVARDRRFTVLRAVRP